MELCKITNLRLHYRGSPNIGILRLIHKSMLHNGPEKDDWNEI